MTTDELKKLKKEISAEIDKAKESVALMKYTDLQIALREVNEAIFQSQKGNTARANNHALVANNKLNTAKASTRTSMDSSTAAAAKEQAKKPDHYLKGMLGETPEPITKRWEAEQEFNTRPLKSDPNHFLHGIL